MNGYSSTSISHGSTGIITGSFGVVDYTENLLTNYFETLSSVLNDVAKEEQKDLRDAARTSPTSWSEIEKSLVVQYDAKKGNIVYTVSGTLQDEDLATSLEYGDSENAPTPLLRSAALQNKDELEQKINTALNNKLMEGFSA